jgi:hypothetical protein
MSGNGSSMAHAARWIQRCSSILMVSAVRVVAIVRTLQKRSVHHAQLCSSVAIKLSQFKSLMEFGAVSQKMTAQKSCHAEE